MRLNLDRNGNLIDVTPTTVRFNAGDLVRVRDGRTGRILEPRTNGSAYLIELAGENHRATVAATQLELLRAFADARLDRAVAV